MRQPGILKLASQRIIPGYERKIIFKPQTKQYAGIGAQRNAAIAAFDGTQRCARHAGAFGQHGRRDFAAQAGQADILAERFLDVFQRRRQGGCFSGHGRFS
jgi:hypothetical protein